MHIILADHDLLVLTGFFVLLMVGVAVAVCILGACCLLLQTLSSSKKVRLSAQASRAAKRSSVAADAGRRLADTATELAEAACVFAGSARQVRREGKIVRYLCCRLYAKWLLIRSQWLCGRAMLLLTKAKNEYQTHLRALKTLKHET